MTEKDREGLEKLIRMPSTTYLFLYWASLGFYYWTWVYRVVLYLREKGLSDEDPKKTAWKCFLIPFYRYFWMRRTAEKIDTLEDRYGRTSKLAYFTGFMFFVPFLYDASIFIQDRIFYLESEQSYPNFDHKAEVFAQTNLIRSKETHILASVLTLGIYDLVWIYRVTRFLNKLETIPKQSPSRYVWLCAVFPSISLYWVYFNSWRLDCLAQQYGIESHIAETAPAYHIFGWFFASTAKMQPVLRETVIQNYISEYGAIHSRYDEVVQYNKEYYCMAFNKLNTSLSTRSWNWAAFLFSDCWAAFRRCYPLMVFGMISHFLFIVALTYAVYNSSGVWTLFIYVIMVMIQSIIAIYGNSVYQNKCKTVLMKSKEQSSPEEQKRYREKYGGVNKTAPVVPLLLILGMLFLFLNYIEQNVFDFLAFFRR